MTKKIEPWPLGGHAPGLYACTCRDCGKQFSGDKRASQCLECAIGEMKAENRQLREENDVHRTDEEPDRLAVLTGALETLREEVRQALVRNST